MNILFITAGEQLPIHQIKRNSARGKKIDNFIHIGIIETLLRHGHTVYIFGQNDYNEYVQYLNKQKSNFSFFTSSETKNEQYLINYENDPNFVLPNNLINLYDTFSLTSKQKEELSLQIIADLKKDNTYVQDPAKYVKAKEIEYCKLKYVQANFIDKILAADIQFDLILCKATSFAKHNLPFNVINKKNGEYFSAMFRTLNYVSAQVDLINKLADVPLVTFIDDPRTCFLNNYNVKNEINDKGIGPYDLTNTPKIVLGQIDDDNIFLTKYKKEIIEKKIPVNVDDNFEDAAELINVPYKYCPIETIFLMRENVWHNFKDFRKIKKNKKFIITAHGVSKRDQYLAEWVWPFVDDDFKVYGRWFVKPQDIENDMPKGSYWSKPELYKKYKYKIENKPIIQIEDEMWDSRYTFIPTTNVKFSNFVTQKFWRTIYYGIIPFFQKDYDTDHIFDVPDILRPNTPEEMWERIEYLDDNHEEYQKVLDHLYALITNEKLKHGEMFYDSLSYNVKKYIGLNMSTWA
jgi:hypothetical protein